MKKKLTVLAILVLSTMLADAELVGSLRLLNNADTNDVLSLAGIPTRTDIATVEGEFSCLGAVDLGVGAAPPYTGIDIAAFTEKTTYRDMDRYGGGEPRGILVWDYDLTGQSAAAWELRVNWDSRRNDPPGSVPPDNWYISFNGFGRTLDTTVVTNLAAGDGSVLVKNQSKYIKIGELPVAETEGTNVWDITEIINVAVTNGGQVRLVYACDGYLDDIGIATDSGLHGTNSTSGDAVYIPEIYMAEDFDTGSNGAGTNDLLNGWVEGGPEAKEWNLASSGLLDIRDAYASSDPEEGSRPPNLGSFETVYIDFDGVQLANDGDWIEFSMDVALLADDEGTGLSVFGLSPVAVLTLTDSDATNNAGYGFRIEDDLYHKLYKFDSPGGFPSSANVVLPDNGSRTLLETNGTLQAWSMRIERENDTLLISPLFDGSLFGGGSLGKQATWTNDLCLGATFDRVLFTIRGNDIRAKIDNVWVASNVEPLGGYYLWALNSGLTETNNAPGLNPDSDALDNLGEYVFDGIPTNGADIGTQPWFDGASGEYIYVLRNDSSLTASVLTKPDLITGTWTTNATPNISLNDGGMSSYTNELGTAAETQFIKLLVE